MESLAHSITRMLITWFAIQAIVSSIFIFYLRSYEKKPIDKEIILPKASVILSLRGADPFLEKCLHAIAHQNYPNYDIKIIVDSLEDPAWNVVNKVANELAINELVSNRMHISLLREVPQTSSLKCAAIVQAVSNLDPDCAVVVLVDADAVVHPNWLRDLITPLAPPEIGATTGNRWYLPTGEYWGSCVRYLWNISAVVQMFLYGIAWGGSLAIKTDVIQQTGLLEKWSHAYADDTPLRRIFSQHDFKIKFVPSAIILNREESHLNYLMNWFRRQLISSRLYHPCWLAVIGDAFSTVIVPNYCLLLFFIALISSQFTAAGILIASFCVYMLALVLLALTVDREVRRVIRTGGEPIPKIGLSTAFKMLIATPLTQWVYIWSLLTTLRMSIIEWRGVVYRITNPWQINVLEYTPYRSQNSSDNRTSL